MTSDTTSDDPEISLGGRHGRKAGRSDDGKPIMHTMDPDFILGIGRVSAFGAKKYSARNFLISPGMEWSRVFDSALRHLFAFWAGEELDEESQLPHLLMASWNLMALYTYSNHQPFAVGDDRPSTLEYDEGSWRDWRAEFELAQQDAAKPAPDPVHLHDSEALAAADPEVKQPAFMKDPLRQGLAEQTKGD